MHRLHVHAYKYVLGPLGHGGGIDCLRRKAVNPASPLVFTLLGSKRVFEPPPFALNASRTFIKVRGVDERFLLRSIRLDPGRLKGEIRIPGGDQSIRLMAGEREAQFLQDGPSPSVGFFAYNHDLGFCGWLV